MTEYPSKGPDNSDGHGVTIAYRPAAAGGRRGDPSVGRTTGGSSAVEATSPAARLLDCYLDSAARSMASDLHFEPSPGGLRVRMRVDGVLQRLESPPPGLAQPLLTRVRLLARVNLAEKRLPQDGRFSHLHRERGRLDVRAAFMPVSGGEKLVLRLLARSSRPLGLKDLGMDDGEERIVNRALSRPTGMIISAGPTGSGKTTTLYAALAQLTHPQVSLVTVEDPVEMELDGISQVQVDEVAGRGFAAVLRALLRQDPDILMIGEMRDTDSAAIACRAALTGHLVLTTLHTADTAEALVRLPEMGVPRYLVAATVSLVIAQRLLRRLCPSCRIEDEPTDDEVEVFRRCGLASPQLVGRPRGCPRCSTDGYKGRCAVFELLDRGCLHAAPTPHRTLMHAGLLKVAALETSFAEVAARCPDLSSRTSGTRDYNRSDRGFAV